MILTIEIKMHKPWHVRSNMRIQKIAHKNTLILEQGFSTGGNSPLGGILYLQGGISHLGFCLKCNVV